MNGEDWAEPANSVFRRILPDDCDETTKERQAIAASEIADGLQAGKTVEIKNAIIHGPLTLRSMVLESEITIERSRFIDPLDCSYATFKKPLTLRASVFERGVNLTMATVDKDILLEKATFKEKVDFSWVKVIGNVQATETMFEGEADFGSAQIGSQAVFTEAEFKKDVSFNTAQIDGPVFFDPAIFEGEVDFVSARMGSDAVFTEAEFSQGASFNRARIEKNAFFDAAIFEGEVDFVSARMGSDAVFTEAKFKKDVSFNTAQIDGPVFFDPAIFEGEVDFVSARMGSDAVFRGARFSQGASFNRARIEKNAFFDPAIFEGEVDFVSTRIGSDAQFTEATFRQYAGFVRMHVEGDLFLDGASFEKDVSFQNSRFGTAFFCPSDKSAATCYFQRTSKIDWMGCTYDRIHPTSAWKDLMDRLDPYDRQPYTQLEEVFRRSGEDHLAKAVYLERKHREYKERIKPNLWKQPHKLLGDLFLHWLTGYGVQLWRLPLFMLGLVLLWMFVFWQDKALEPKGEDCVIVVNGTSVKLQPSAKDKDMPGLASAFWVSVRTFLPVEIPAGSRWKPSTRAMWQGPLSMTYETFATFLKLFGWILVPVGVAGLTGLLKR
ncbi:MAG TPA: pentapeptide repeat-containing protein [Syntrophorhabdales bacterium]|nr:pentapeptide repeat-containing protein [Syntrophorhabdales bacterium]